MIRCSQHLRRRNRSDVQDASVFKTPRSRCRATAGYADSGLAFSSGRARPNSSRRSKHCIGASLGLQASGCEWRRTLHDIHGRLGRLSWAYTTRAPFKEAMLCLTTERCSLQSITRVIFAPFRPRTIPSEVLEGLLRASIGRVDRFGRVQIGVSMSV